MKNIKCIISLIVVLCITLTLVGCGNKEKSVPVTENDYEQGTKVSNAENLDFEDNGITLSLDYETCNITVTENESGRVWKSNPNWDYEDIYATGVNKTNIFSQIALAYVGTSNDSKNTNSYVSSVKKGNYEIYKIKNGFRVDYTFNEGFFIPVEYVLTNGCFEASILYSGIKETGDNKLSTIALLPYFGIASETDNGMLLVPDGSGAVINFNNGKNECAPYKAKVYGIDESLPNDIVTTRTEQIYIPIMGMKKNDGAYVAFVSEGAAEAYLNASVAGINSGFNNIYFEAIYRESQNLSVVNGSLGTAGLVLYSSEETSDIPRFTVKYSFVKSQNATLGDMVSLAKEQLISSDSIAKTDDNSSLYVDFYGGVNKQKSFVGIQYTGVESLTTFKQAQELLKTLKSNGATNLSVGYKNYSKSYFANKLMSDTTPISALGGKKGIEKLEDYAKNNGAELYFEADFYSLKQSGNGFSKFFDISMGLDLGANEVYIQKLNTNVPNTSSKPYYLLKPSSFNKAAESILKTADKSGINGLYLGDISSKIGGDYDLGGAKRTTATLKVVEAVSKLSDKKLLLSSPNFYLWKYMSAATNVPVTSSGYHLFDYDVPLVQMLLKGKVPYAGYPLNLSNTNDNSFLLHIAYAQNIHYGFMAEEASALQTTDLLSNYGLSSAALLTSAENYAKFSEFYEFVKDKYITDYTFSNNLSITSYSDSTQVLVNFSEKVIKTENDIAVAPRGWTVVKDDVVVSTGGEA